MMLCVALLLMVAGCTGMTTDTHEITGDITTASIDTSTIELYASLPNTTDLTTRTSSATDLSTLSIVLSTTDLNSSSADLSTTELSTSSTILSTTDLSTSSTILSTTDLSTISTRTKDTTLTSSSEPPTTFKDQQTTAQTPTTTAINTEVTTMSLTTGVKGGSESMTTDSETLIPTTQSVIETTTDNKDLEAWLIPTIVVISILVTVVLILVVICITKRCRQTDSHTSMTPDRPRVTRDKISTPIEMTINTRNCDVIDIDLATQNKPSTRVVSKPTATIQVTAEVNKALTPGSQAIKRQKPTIKKKPNLKKLAANNQSDNVYSNTVFDDHQALLQSRNHAESQAMLQNRNLPDVVETSQPYGNLVPNTYYQYKDIQAPTHAFSEDIDLEENNYYESSDIINRQNSSTPILEENTYYESSDINPQGPKSFIADIHYDSSETPRRNHQNSSIRDNKGDPVDNTYYDSTDILQIANQHATTDHVMENGQGVNEPVEYAYTYTHFKLEGRERSHKK